MVMRKWVRAWKKEQVFEWARRNGYEIQFFGKRRARRFGRMKKRKYYFFVKVDRIREEEVEGVVEAVAEERKEKKKVYEGVVRLKYDSMRHGRSGHDLVNEFEFRIVSSEELSEDEILEKLREKIEHELLGAGFSFGSEIYDEIEVGITFVSDAEEWEDEGVEVKKHVWKHRID